MTFRGLLKVEGAGNDFLLGTGDWAERIAADRDLVARLCRRRRGIGADGALALFGEGDNHVRLVHRNADGSPSDFCANGTRCGARVAVEHLGCSPRLTVRTGWAAIPAEVSRVNVTLELPRPGAVEELILTTATGRWPGRLLSVGVPHLVVPVGDLDAIDLDAVAQPLRHHPELGPAGANVHLVEQCDDGRLRIRSLERGVESEVLCCGSGVAAAGLVTLADTGKRSVTVLPRSGDELVVDATGQPPVSPCRLTGPARIVAEVEPL